MIPAVYFAGLGIMTLNCILLNRINFMLCSVMMCVSSIVGSIFLNLRNISDFTFGINNIFDVPDVLNILFNTLQYFTFYIITLIVLALYNYATHPKVKIEQSKYPNTQKRWATPTVFWIILNYLVLVIDMVVIPSVYEIDIS